MSAPLDEWRICGRRVDPRRPLQGCICNERDPSPWLAAEALARLHRHDQEGGAPVTAPQLPRAARKARR